MLALKDLKIVLIVCLQVSLPSAKREYKLENDCNKRDRRGQGSKTEFELCVRLDRAEIRDGVRDVELET